MSLNITEEEQNTIIKQYEKMIFSLVFKITSNKLNIEDLKQIGFIKLFNCIEKFDEKKASFSTFAYTSIRRELLKENTKMAKVAKEKDNYIKESGRFNNSYVSSNNYNSIKDTTLDIYDIINNKTMNERDTIILKMKMTGSTLSEISKKLGISIERTRQLHEKIKEKLIKKLHI